MTELSKLSVDELKKRMNKAEVDINIYKNQQMSIKILLNSFYGALANNYFKFYDVRVAEAITLSGQLAIRWVEKKMNEYLNRTLKTKDVDYVIAMDTDSVAGDSIIRVNGEDITISDFYNSIPSTTIVDEEKVVKCTKGMGYTTPSVSKELQLDTDKRINYVMKHKCRKRMYKIKIKDNHVVVTEDHSLIVYNKGELIERKPAEIQTGDKLVKIL